MSLQRKRRSTRSLSDNLGCLWQSPSRPLSPPKTTLTGQYFLQRARLPCPTNGPAFCSMLSLQSLCYRRYSGSQGMAQDYSNSPPLEEPTVGVGVIPAAEISPVADPLDLLSQAKDTIWHPWPELWALYVWPLDGSLSSSQIL